MYLNFEIDENGIYNADCLLNFDKVGYHSVDLILTDLPYGTTACKWDSILPFDKLWEMVNYVLKPNGTFITTASQPFTSALIMSNPSMFKYCWTWIKSRPTGFANAKKQPLRCVEDIVVFYNKPPKYNPQGLIKIDKICKNSNTCGGETVRNDIEESKGKGSLRTGGKEYTQEFTNYPRQVLEFKQETGLHPTQKPVTLMEYLLLTYSNKFDMVFDPCAGSGTTAIACENLDRDYICFEKDYEICRKANERLDAHTKLL